MVVGPSIRVGHCGAECRFSDRRGVSRWRRAALSPVCQFFLCGASCFVTFMAKTLSASATTNTTRRLLKELQAVVLEQQTSSTSSKIDVFLTCPNEDDLFAWRAWILGPPDTPYSDTYFELRIVVPATYPLQPPTVNFLTRVFHPNVHFKVRCASSGLRRSSLAF